MKQQLKNIFSKKKKLQKYGQKQMIYIQEPKFFVFWIDDI